MKATERLEKAIKHLEKFKKKFPDFKTDELQEMIWELEGMKHSFESQERTCSMIAAISPNGHFFD